MRLVLPSITGVFYVVSSLCMWACFFTYNITYFVKYLKNLFKKQAQTYSNHLKKLKNMVSKGWKLHKIVKSNFKIYFISKSLIFVYLKLNAENLKYHKENH